jgi:VanZ family protein
LRRLFVVICALLLYGSLFPWRWHDGTSLATAVGRVFHSWPTEYSTDVLQDLALNIVVYVPLGLVGYLAGKGGGFRLIRALLPVTVGFLLSLLVETLQSYVPGREPSLSDLLCNTGGSLAGVLIAILYENVVKRLVVGLAEVHLRRRPSSALMMLVVFAGQIVAPTLLYSYQWLTHSDRAHAGPDPGTWSQLMNAMASWLIAGRFLEMLIDQGPARLAILLRTSAALGMLALTAVIVRLLVPMTHAELAGAALGAVLYVATFLLFAPKSRDRLLAAAGLVWLVGDGLRPYQFTAHNSFEWIPFFGMLGSNWLGSILVLLNKTWMYGSAFWVWERAGFSRWNCVVFLMTVLTAIEIAQLYLPERTATITDLAMGGIAAGLLWSVERKYGQ